MAIKKPRPEAALPDVSAELVVSEIDERETLRKLVFVEVLAALANRGTAAKDAVVIALEYATEATKLYYPN